MRLEYAEKFGLDPDTARPKLRTWLEWQAWETAKAAKNANRRAMAITKAGGSWAEQLSPEERKLLLWLELDDSDNGEGLSKNGNR